VASDRIIVIGAGMGGLTTAAWLARNGRQVLVLEAREEAGGLASRFTVDDSSFDAGPYILLDRHGLEWAFSELAENLASHLSLQELDDIYQVEWEDGPTIRVFGSLEATAAELDSTWPGAGKRYARFVARMGKVHERLRPLQFTSRPGPSALLRHGALGQVPFLLRPLSGVLNEAGLPREVVEALSIWTHVAGQRAEEAPSPLAFVPALIHRYGAYVPKGGIAEVPAAFEKIARKAGAEFRFGARVRRIRCANGRVSGVEVDGEMIEAKAVVSNAGAIGTYLGLLEGVRERFARSLRRLPLQSPGVCAYLAVEGAPRPPYLRFRLPKRGLCRLLVQPGVVDPSLSNTARLLGPVSHAWAQRSGPNGQRAYLEEILGETWWRDNFTRVRTLASRVPHEWGDEFNLYDDSMNPVMTAKLMLRGRIAHKSPIVEGLYFAGSSTHPGQWVSFCAISGILAAREVAC
jgi:phytoene dehydrogenase-like protein